MPRWSPDDPRIKKNKQNKQTNQKAHKKSCIFDLNNHFDHECSHGTVKIRIYVKLLHTTLIYIEFGATGACFVTKQGQESINRKIRTLEHRNRQRNFNVLFMKWSTV